MAKTVADCAKADAVMAGDDYAPLEPVPLAGLRIGIAQGLPLEKLDDTVGQALSASHRLAGAGRRPAFNEKLPLLDDMARVNASGGVQPAEAYRYASRPVATARRRDRSERPRAARARAAPSRPPISFG